MKVIAFDTETDGLLDELTTIHCLNLVNMETEERLRFNDQPEVSDTNRAGSVEEGIAYLNEHAAKGYEISAHNLYGFDKLAIVKVYGEEAWEVPEDLELDTLIVSRLIWTDLKEIDHRAIAKGRRPQAFLEKHLAGRNSLEAWGFRFGEPKGDFKGPWDTFTVEMDDYCARDVEVLVDLIKHIKKQNYSEEAIRLEHRVFRIIQMQEWRGFLFDVEEAHRLEAILLAEKAELEDQLREAFQPWFEAEKKYGKPIIMDPKRRRRARMESEDGQTWRALYTPGEPYCKVKLVSFEPGSRQMIANRLKVLFDWQPQEFTPTGLPKIDESTLAGLNYPEAILLRRYLTVDKRLGQLATGKEAWLKHVGDDGIIHGRVNTMGTVTGRMSHSNPNLAQVPKVKKAKDGTTLMGYEGGYGVECRSLFRARPGYDLVGTDADGLELRMLAHYMARYDKGEFAKAVVQGNSKDGTDPHTINQRILGLRLRDSAKTWIYAYLYGAGDLKLGTIIFEDMDEKAQAAFNAKVSPGRRDGALAHLGKTGRAKIEKGLPALGALQKEVKRVARKEKRLKSLDGRYLHVRGLHSALNTLLQGGGAVVMKKALVLAYDKLSEKGWVHGRDYSFVANVHDEFQKEALPEISQEVGQIAADAIAAAGEALGLRVSLAGSYDVGQTWADTH